MSWFNNRILSKKDLEETAQSIPSRLQVGDDCNVYVVDEGKDVYLPGKIVGVNIGRFHAVSYDVAFAIGASGYYSVATGFRGNVLPAGVVHDGNDPLIDPEAAKERLAEFSAKRARAFKPNKLSVVASNDMTQGPSSNEKGEASTEKGNLGVKGFRVSLRAVINNKDSE